MGIVGLGGDGLQADGVDVGQTHLVVEEAHEHMVAVVGGRRLGHLVGHPAPGGVLLPHHIHPVQDVGQPAHLPLRVGNFEAGEAHEHPRHQKVHQRVGGVGVDQRRAHRTGGVGRGGHHLRGRPDVHAHHGGRLFASGEEGIPVPGVDRRQAQVGRDLRETHRPYASLGVAPHLGGGQLHVPQRDEAQRDQPPGGGTAPLLHHPVVVGLNTQQGQIHVGGLGKGLAAEPGE